MHLPHASFAMCMFAMLWTWGIAAIVVGTTASGDQSNSYDLLSSRVRPLGRVNLALVSVLPADQTTEAVSGNSTQPTIAHATSDAEAHRWQESCGGCGQRFRFFWVAAGVLGDLDLRARTVPCLCPGLWPVHG